VAGGTEDPRVLDENDGKYPNGSEVVCVMMAKADAGLADCTEE
jgi:hypothetical protein